MPVKKKIYPAKTAKTASVVRPRKKPKINSTFSDFVPSPPKKDYLTDRRRKRELLDLQALEERVPEGGSGSGAEKVALKKAEALKRVSRERSLGVIPLRERAEEEVNALLISNLHAKLALLNPCN